MSWNDPRTWLGSEELTATLLNAQLRDNMKALTEWTSYTPTFTSTGTTPNVGTLGTKEGAYILAGDMCLWWAKVKFDGTSISAGSGNYLIGLPTAAPARGGNYENFAAQHLRAATLARTVCVGYLVTASTVALNIAGGATLWSSTSPAAPAAGDFGTVSGVYQAAV